MNNTVIVFGIADNHVRDAGIDYHAFAHRATVGIFNILAGVTFNPDQIQRAAEHFIAGTADNGICLGVDAPAKLIAFTARYIHFGANAEIYVCAVFTPAGRADIAGGNYFVILDDDRAVPPAKASASLSNNFG